MGQAYKAPRAVYQRSYYITTHVIDRLRLRSPDGDILSNSVIFRSDVDLMNRIDEAIKLAISSNHVHHVWDNGDPARIIWVADWFLDSKLIYILLKRDAKNERMWAAVTVFTETQFENNKRNKRWNWADTPHPELLSPRTKSVTREPVTVVLPRPAIIAASEPRAFTGDAVVFYYRTKSGSERFERCIQSIAANRASEIVGMDDYVDGTLEIYNKQKTEIRVVPKTSIDF